MRTLGIGIAAAITLAAAMAPANAQGLWIGAPGFGVGLEMPPNASAGDVSAPGTDSTHSTSSAAAIDASSFTYWRRINSVISNEPIQTRRT